MILDEKLADGELLIIDGAIGTEIARMGGEMSTAAWCGTANKTHADVVRRVHRAYLEAGVDIVTSNTFATCRHVLAAEGLADEAPELTARAVELAKQAIDEASPDRPVAVAGSMSNNLAWIPGTFSPDPRFLPTLDEEAANYREMADALTEAGADLILLEMMSDITHASMAAEAAAATGLPVWIGISCALQPDGSVSAWDMHTVEPAERIDGSHKQPTIIPLSEVIAAMLAFNPQVVGIMHSTTEATSPGIAALKRQWSGPVMAYPEATGQYFVEPADFAKNNKQLVDDGVQIVGGCCGTSVDHIATMVELLDR